MRSGWHLHGFCRILRARIHEILCCFSGPFARRDLDVLASQGKIRGGARLKQSILKAILTDSQFWAPAIALALGIVLLAYLH